MALVDAYGREYPAKRPETGEFDAGGATAIRNNYSSYPSRGLTPGALAEILREADTGNVRRQMELYEEMEEKDAHLSSVLQSRRLAVTGLDYEVQAASEDKRDEDVAAFVRESLAGIRGLRDSVFDLLDAVGKGFSVCESVWRIEGGRALVSELRHWPARAFTFMERGGLISPAPKIVTDNEQVYGEALDPGRFIVHMARSRSGIASRGGMLRPCAWMYLFKNYSVKDWVVFNERFAMPLRVGKYGQGATEEERKVLRDAVVYLGADAAAIISEGTSIDFVESKGSKASADIYSGLIAYCDRSMTKAILGHTGASDSTPGKLGSEDMAQEVRADLLRADAEALAATIRRDLLAPLVLYNFGPDVAVPGFSFSVVEEEDLQALAESLTSVNAMGVPIPHSHVREKFGIPEARDDEPVTSGQSTETPDNQTQVENSARLQRMDMSENSSGDAVDGIESRLNDEAPVDSLWPAIEKIIAEAESLDDLYERIDSAYEHMDPTALADLIQKALMIAELQGRYEVSNGDN